MKLAYIAFSLLLFTACSNPPNQNQTTTDSSQISPQDSLPPELMFRINRAQTRKLNVSVNHVASRIKTLIDTTSQAFTPEELMDQHIIFSNNSAQVIEIPIRTVVDSFFYENSPPRPGGQREESSKR